MIQGSGTISNYGSYINNCQADQWPYKIPVNYLSNVQLYIKIGDTRPDTVQYELLHTCGTQAGAIENITPANYVVAQDSNGLWYGVFKNFSGASPECFVIAITLTSGSTDAIYFSDEYCIDVRCKDLIFLQGCYGNLDDRLAYDCEGIYFGTGSGNAMGDTSLKYKHELYLRDVEVSLAAIKNSFKQGRTRNFRTEKENIFQFYAEFVPEWYLTEIEAVFYRGEVFVGSTKYLVNETQFEKIEDCKRAWKPAATFKESCYLSFTCEADPCNLPPTDCCDPVVVCATVEEVPFEVFPSDSGFSGFAGGSRIVVVQAVVDGTVDVTGTTNPVTGVTGGSLAITCIDFAFMRVFVERGSVQIQGIDPGDGSNYYVKVFSSDTIYFSNSLVPGEIIYIETIP